MMEIILLYAIMETFCLCLCMQPIHKLADMPDYICDAVLIAERISTFNFECCNQK